MVTRTTSQSSPFKAIALKAVLDQVSFFNLNLSPSNIMWNAFTKKHIKDSSCCAKSRNCTLGDQSTLILNITSWFEDAMCQK